MKKMAYMFFVFCLCTTLKNRSIVLSGNDSDRTIQSSINSVVNDNGLLDQTFGKLGTTYLSPSIAGGTFDQINAIGIQQDGKIVVAGRTNDQNGQTYFGVARYLSNGQLDVTFGETTTYTTSIVPGTVYINIFAGNFSFYIPNALVIQPDGAIVVGGEVPNANNITCFGLIRLLSNGILDNSFGVTEGSVVSSFPGTCYVNGSIGNGRGDLLNGLALQEDGKIIAGGTSQDQFLLAQFLSNGELDSTFGVAIEPPLASNIKGTLYINQYIAGGGSDQMGAILLQSDGKIVAVGNSNDANANFATRVAVVRFMPDGSLDSSFGKTVNESTTVPFPGAVYITNTIMENGINDYILGAALQSDGALVLVGYSILNDGNNYFSLVRFLANGILDTSFGQNIGNALTFIPGTVYIYPAIGIVNGSTPNNQFHAVSIQADQKIVAAGLADIGGRGHFTVARFLSNGMLDSIFGGFGKDTTMPLPGIVYVTNSIAGAAANNTTDYIYAAAIQNDGNIVVAGFTNTNANANYFALVRFFNPNNFNTYTTAYESVGAGLYC